MSKWTKIVGFSILGIAAAIIIWDIVLAALGKPTFSEVTWERATHMAFVPTAWGYLMGHWFMSLKAWPKVLHRAILWCRKGWWVSILSYAGIVLTLDLVIKWHLPYWLVLLVFLLNIPVGGFFWNMERKSDPTG